jgi:hypothetical protein
MTSVKKQKPLLNSIFLTTHALLKSFLSVEESPRHPGPNALAPPLVVVSKIMGESALSSVKGANH